MMSRQVTEQAMEWLQVLQQPAPGQQEAFVDWVRASPENLREFLVAQTMHQALASLDWDAMPEIGKALVQASSNVIQLPAAAQPHGAPSASRPGHAERKVHRRWFAGAAVAMAGAAVWGLAGHGDPTYRTSIGEQRKVELEDRSVVNLNSRSRMELRFSDRARDVMLDGEALFKVEHDPGRPFRVHSGVAVIQALGTQFNVRQLPSGITVSVIEGAVRVAAAGQVRLAAGEEARIDIDGRVHKRTIPDMAGAATWQRNRLVFRGNTLEDIAAEFNRWNTRQIHIEPGAGAGLLYDGAFDADDPQSLIEFLRQSPGLTVTEEGERRVIRRAHRAPATPEAPGVHHRAGW